MQAVAPVQKCNTNDCRFQRVTNAVAHACMRTQIRRMDVTAMDPPEVATRGPSSDTLFSPELAATLVPKRRRKRKKTCAKDKVPCIVLWRSVSCVGVGSKGLMKDV